MSERVETITKFEVLFAIRTGVTVLLPRVSAFDAAKEQPIRFSLCVKNPQHIVIHAGSKAVRLENLRKEHLDAAVQRGFIMFYEMDDEEEVVRCTPCSYQKA